MVKFSLDLITNWENIVFLTLVYLGFWTNLVYLGGGGQIWAPLHKMLIFYDMKLIFSLMLGKVVRN